MHGFGVGACTGAGAMWGAVAVWEGGQRMASFDEHWWPLPALPSQSVAMAAIERRLKVWLSSILSDPTAASIDAPDIIPYESQLAAIGGLPTVIAVVACISLIIMLRGFCDKR